MAKLIDEKTYLNFIKDALEKETWEVVDIANKMVMDQRKISLDTYLKAANLIVDKYLLAE